MCSRCFLWRLQMLIVFLWYYIFAIHVMWVWDIWTWIYEHINDKKAYHLLYIHLIHWLGSVITSCVIICPTISIAVEQPLSLVIISIHDDVVKLWRIFQPQIVSISYSLKAIDLSSTSYHKPCDPIAVPSYCHHTAVSSIMLTFEWVFLWLMAGGKNCDGSVGASFICEIRIYRISIQSTSWIHIIFA